MPDDDSSSDVGPTLMPAVTLPESAAPADKRGAPSAQYEASDLSAKVLASLLARIARSLDGDLDVDATMLTLVTGAVEAVPGAQSGGITEVDRRGRQVMVRYASDSFVVALDAAQLELAQGPCLDVAAWHRTMRVEDFAEETRWPEFSARALELGARSLLSLQLYAGSDNLAALNLYSRRPRAFTDESEEIGLLFATHAAIAMSRARRDAQMRLAIDSRDIIGQAKGILMERFKINAEQAFQVLVKASTQTNVKVRDVAEKFAATDDEPRA